MKILRVELLKDLAHRTEVVKREAMQLLALSDEKLTQRADPEKWNALECIEHFNLYGDFYLKEIEQRILSAGMAKEAVYFKSSFLGNKFALSVKPAQEGKKLNSMATFKDKNTLHFSLTKNCIERFILQQEHMLALLKRAEKINLTKVKTAISISKWLYP